MSANAPDVMLGSDVMLPRFRYWQALRALERIQQYAADAVSGERSSNEMIGSIGAASDEAIRNLKGDA